MEESEQRREAIVNETSIERHVAETPTLAKMVSTVPPRDQKAFMAALKCACDGYPPNSSKSDRTGCDPRASAAMWRNRNIFVAMLYTLGRRS